MGRPTPIKTLEAEHRAIERVVAEMRVSADRIESAKEADAAPVESLIEFLRDFADRRHHGKEEQLLFPALERLGVPSQGCPLGGLTMEHQKGRAMVGDLAGSVRGWRNGEPGAAVLVAANLRALAAFYTSHIWNEDNLLFPLAAKILTPADQAELAQRFEEIDAKCPTTST
jgi:hemerythrin-like domain-containing protein